MAYCLTLMTSLATFPGWWFSHPSEKYESQLGWWHSLYIWENKIDVPNHQPVSVVRFFPWFFPWIMVNSSLLQPVFPRVPRCPPRALEALGGGAILRHLFRPRARPGDMASPFLFTHKTIGILKETSKISIKDLEKPSVYLHKHRFLYALSSTREWKLKTQQAK